LAFIVRVRASPFPGDTKPHTHWQKHSLKIESSYTLDESSIYDPEHESGLGPVQAGATVAQGLASKK
jgi:hypothetical protein